MDSKTLYSLLGDNFSVSTDTRTIRPADIYIGIRGEQFDGNTFASQALEKGAKCAIVDDPAYQINSQCILVTDTKKTLEELAKLHRERFSIPVLVIGGSNGKTTTKELVHAVLSKRYKVHTTKGNLNNDIGVPLTILAMPRDSEIAVIEVGANHRGEHTKLLDLIRPTHVLVTNNGRDHLEGFGSAEGVRAANKEIFDWAKQHGAITLVNTALLDLVEDSEKTKRQLYPLKSYVALSGIYAGISYERIEMQSALFGSYNVPNIIAAVTVGELFSVPVFDIAAAIELYKPTLKRSEIIERDGYSLVLDCYNANPTSMTLALTDFFATTPAGMRIIIIGDMLEMGAAEQAVHREILDFTKNHAFRHDTVICVGPRFGVFKDSYPFHFFETSQTAGAYFNTLDLIGKHIFVKASRGIKLEEAIKEKIPF